MRFSLSSPDVSIVIPVYNTGPLLLEAIESIVTQAPTELPLPVVEVIVVDDASGDANTQSILASLEARYPGVLRVLRNQRSKGVAGARNTAIEAARGQWIGFLDSDDLWLPNAMASLWQVVREHPQARWVAAHFLLTMLGSDAPPENKPLAERSPYLYSLLGSDYEAGRATCLKQPVSHFLKSCLIGIMTCLIRKELLIDAGLFDENQKRASDYMMWLRCALLSDLYYAPADTGIYRMRKGSLTRTSAPPLACEDSMLRKLLADPRYTPWNRQLRERLVLVLDDHCYYYRNAKHRSEARHWALKLLREAPLRARTWKQALGAWMI
ncbi:glycosyltransferase [Chitinivorax sp. PXF-14]|uniref:glycosyltransferase family 2 protein n=1 Tax=Chitinivorax sp. PXF-14 TaxID=3230488 RepID=UPI003467B201